MDRASGRFLDPEKPWPTVEEASRRLVALIVAVTVAQFLLNGLDNVVEGYPMFMIWVASALLVGIATFRIRRYFAWRRRFGR